MSITNHYKITTIIIFIVFAIFSLTGCAEVDLSQTDNQTIAQNSAASSKTASFRGTKGDFIAIQNEKVVIDASKIDDGKAHYFNTTLPNGEPVYFFVIKSPDGKLRAAANGCQVCGGALQGFRQEGNNMVCNTCGNRYPLNKIATEKGGCNPAPINPDLKVKNGKISITLSELQDIEQFFK